MYVAEVAKNFLNIQNALLTIATLVQPTSYRYPQAESVSNGATYDYIVVGAGTAGSVVANRLTEDPGVSVLLIEAGGDAPMEAVLPGIWSYGVKSHIDWQHTSQVDANAFRCHQGNQLHLSHGKVLGGSSSINGMVYMRGDPNDYDRWAAIAKDQSWNFTNVLPYFKKSERLEEPAILNSPYAEYHGFDGYLGVTKLNDSESDEYLEAFQEIGYKNVLDVNGESSLGMTQQMLIIADGIRQSTANAFLSVLRNRSNLHIMKNSLVTKVIIDKNKTARGVVVKDSTNTTITVKANKEVILSAGAFNTPQILMLSGIGPKDKLRKLKIKVVADLPVGVELADHRLATIFFKTKKPYTNNKPANPHKFPALLPSGYKALNSSQSYADFQLTVLGTNADGMLSFCATLYFYTLEICQYFYDQMKGNDSIIMFINNAETKPQGYVTLNSANPEDSPNIHMYSFPDEIDLDKYVSYFDDVTRIVNTTYFKSIGAELIKLPQCTDYPEGREYWQCYLSCLTTTGLHFSRTCAMGSVVDSRLRVYGIKGLRVVDAGVMPTITSGNTMIPTIMIGEKASDMIKEDNC